MPPAAEASSPSRRGQGNGADGSRDFKDNFVPRFDNVISNYKEWRKRVALYSRKMQIQGRSKETALNILSSLEGISWTQCEDIDLKDLEQENGIDILLRRLDKQWKYDEKVETPGIFDAFFFKLQRRQGQSLLEYVTEFHQALRDVQRLKIDLPEQITGWLLLRRAALSREQQHLVQTQIGTTLTLPNVEESLFLVFGQDYRQVHVQPHGHGRGKGGYGKQRTMVHAAEDDEPWDEDYDDGYYNEDDDYQADDTWYGEEEVAEAYEYHDAGLDMASEGAGEMESIFDVEEYDTAYAAYVDAKQRVQALRQSRGFYPVVAMIDTRSQTGSAGSFDNHKGGSKAQGKGSSKSKGKSPPKSSKGNWKGPKARAKGFFNNNPDDTCLRCGKPGHRAAQCTAPSRSSQPSSSSPGKKRVIDLDPMVNMVFETDEIAAAIQNRENAEFHDCEEVYAQGDNLVRAGGWMSLEPDVCVQDQGASSFLAGSEYVLRYLMWLETLGYDMGSIVFKRCDKHFRFGGDHEGHSRWMVELPVNIVGTPGRIQCYIIFGTTPMLFGRPILERLGAVVDFAGNRMKILGKWMEILRGKQMAMLLRLAQDVTDPSQFEQPVFDLRSQDDDHEGPSSFKEFLSDLRAEERYEEMRGEVQFENEPEEEDALFYYDAVEDMPESTCFEAHEVQEKSQPGMQKTWQWIEEQILEAEREMQSETQKARAPQKQRRKLIFEVYAGAGRLSKWAEKFGAEVMTFGSSNGWDFSRAAHRKQLVRLVEDLEPDEIFMSPKCTLWSSMQNINVRSEEDAAELEEARQFDHEIHLKFCRKLYWMQVRRGDHAHLEHPQTSLAWSTPALCKLPGHRTTFDQCEYGAVMSGPDGELPIRKPTSIQTTKRAMCLRMSKRCSGQHQHQRLEGGQRCKASENYQDAMAWHLAKALMDDEGLSEQAFAVQENTEAEELTGILRKLSTRHGSEAVRIAYRLHRNLGHPRKEVLLKMLEKKACSQQVKDAVQDLECPFCHKHSVRKGTAPAHADRPEEFNEVLQADVMWFDLSEGEAQGPQSASSRSSRKIAILVMIDTATRFMSARTIPDETGASFQKAVEREWIRVHGPPKKLCVDEGTGWGSDSTALWAEHHAIELVVSPGQAHTRTSVVERRHQILRKSLSTFMLEQGLHNLDGLHSALNWIVPSLNQYTFVNGYTPMQLALGRQPSIPGLMSEERTGPLQLQVSEQEKLHRRLEMRMQAQHACARAEIDVKLRRAMLRKFTGKDEEVSPGERCLYWRESGNRFHTVQWRGPAVVVAVQRDPDSGSIDTYWIAHGTVLIRAARQHVRKMPDDEGRIGGEQRAQQALEGLRQRRVVRVVDLRRVNRHSLEELEGEISDQGDPEAGNGHERRVAPRLDAGPVANQEAEAEMPQPVDVIEVEPPPAEDRPPDLDGSPLSNAEAQRQVTSATQDEPMEEPRLELPRPDLPDLIPPHELPPVPETPSAAPQIDPSFLPVQGEDFASQRRRIDQQETIWMRRPSSMEHERPVPEAQEAQRARKKARRLDEEDDLFSFEPFGFDMGKSTKLPGGWHYDQETNEFWLGETEDFWSVEDGFVVRHHVIAREETYVAESDDFPVPRADVQLAYGMTMIDGTRKVHVNEKESQKFGDGPWFGKTLYPLTKEAAEKYGYSYVGDFATKAQSSKSFRSRGHIWSAVASPSKKKKANDAADLSERKMRLEDRLAFVQGKKAELASIFENQVWEIEMQPEKVDWGRVMKARFVLKWATDAKGQPRAKARLVLQGFSDPDLLRGELDTSSPTLGRTSRQTTLALATILGWSLWVSDVATAFLQGDPQERVLWAKIPKDACQLIGVPAGTLMRLLKPLYGQADAPRAWFQVARRRLISCGYTPHPLDSCMFLLFDGANLVSAIGVHVDDLLGGGDESSSVYAKAKDDLKREFQFKHWTSDQETDTLEFCGCKLVKKGDAWVLHQQDYMAKVKPLTIQDSRDPNRELNQKEVSGLRALLGALQWPSTQTSPHLCASVSLVCGMVSKAVVETAQAANKILRFAKQNSDVGLKFMKLGALKDLCMIAMSDAAWGVRSDMKSQGGYLILLAHKDVLKGKMDQDYIILDWRSYKLPRISRSSLNAEAQACSGAVDALEYLMIFWHGCIHPGFQLRKFEMSEISMDSALVIDAKALYDCIKSEVPQLQGDKRTKIEVMVVKEKMEDMGTCLRWVSSEVQLSDGATKIAARQLFADRLRTHQFSLKSDASFVAAKRKSTAERQANARRNAVSRLVNKQSLAFAVLTSEILPVQGDELDSEQDMFMLDVVFAVLVVLLSMFLFQCMWRCRRSMHHEPPSDPPSSDETNVTRTPSSNETTSRSTSETLRPPRSTEQSESENELAVLRNRNRELVKQATLLHHRCQMLQQQVNDRDGQNDLLLEDNAVKAARIRALQSRLLDQRYPDIHVSKTGVRYHLSTDCEGLNNASQTRLRQLDVCSFCASSRAFR